MSWDSTKVDNDATDLVNGILNAKDWNDQVIYIKAISSDLGVIDGGNSTD
jgi:hypothetical protein